MLRCAARLLPGATACARPLGPPRRPANAGRARRAEHARAQCVAVSVDHARPRALPGQARESVRAVRRSTARPKDVPALSGTRVARTSNEPQHDRSLRYPSEPRDRGCAHAYRHLSDDAVYEMSGVHTGRGTGAPGDVPPNIQRSPGEINCTALKTRDPARSASRPTFARTDIACFRHGSVRFAPDTEPRQRAQTAIHAARRRVRSSSRCTASLVEEQSVGDVEGLRRLAAWHGVGPALRRASPTRRWRTPRPPWRLAGTRRLRSPHRDERPASRESTVPCGTLARAQPGQSCCRFIRRPGEHGLEGPGSPEREARGLPVVLRRATPGEQPCYGYGSR